MLKRLLLGFFMVLPSLWAYSQTEITDQDNLLWTGATLKLEFTKKWRGELEQQVRFDQDISSFKNTFTEVGLRHKFNKFISFKGRYRYIIRNDKNNRQRISGDLYFGWKKKKFPLRFQYRTKIQHTTEIDSEDKFIFWRNRAKVEYNLSKIVDPYLSAELFYRFDQKNEFRTLRYALGLDWKLTKSLELTTFYFHQKEINVNNPEKENVFGLMLGYKIDLKK